MTRFMITLEQAVELVALALKDSIGGEIYISKIPSMKVIDIAKTIDKKIKLNLWVLDRVKNSRVYDFKRGFLLYI